MFGWCLEVNFYIIIGYINVVMNINKCVYKVGLEVKDIIFEFIVFVEVVLSEEEKEVGVVFVDIGGGMIDVVIFYEGVICYMVVILFGGNVIIDDIKEGCMIFCCYVEQLKVKFGFVLVFESFEIEVVCILGLCGCDLKEIILCNFVSIIQVCMEEIIEYVYYEI